MAAGAAVDASTVEHLAEEADRGRRYLEKLELPEAEEVFRGILQRLPMYHSVQTDRIIVASLVGLAEIHAKHCRSVRDMELDWLCGMLFALLFYRAAGEVCAKVIRHRKQERNAAASNGNGNGNGDYFSDVLSRSKREANTVEVCLLGAFRDRVLERCTSFSRYVATVQRKSGFDDAWLDGLWEFCVRSAADYQIDYNANGPTEPQLNDAGNSSRGRRRYSLISRDGLSRLPSRPTDPVEEAAAWSTRPTSPGAESVQSSVSVPVGGRRRINFDRFQDAIKHFVTDVSTDIRNKYMHISGKIPHGLLEQRVCSELALRLSQGSEDGQELEEIFETLLADDDGMSMGTIDEEDLEEATNQSQNLSSGEEDYDEEEVVDDDDAVETIELYIKPSAMHSDGRTGDAAKVTAPSKDVVLYVNGPTNSALVPAKGKTKTPSTGSVTNAKKNSRVMDAVVATSETSWKNDIHLSDESGKLSHTGGGNNGVMTKWLGKSPSSECHLLPWSTVGGFEEVSQFTEKKERVPLSLTESEVGLHRYINESKLSQLLGSTASKLADSLKKELRFLEACQLYKYAFGIFKGYPLVGGQQEMLARLLVDIGSTCCSLGELESGSQLMKEAAGLYECEGEKLKSADAWYQMGNAFLADNLRLESLLARMMQLTKEDLQEDADAELGDGSSICSSSSSNPNEDDDTYCPCILEAIACYQRALEEIESLSEGRKNPDLLANILSNLADCRLMTGSLDLAERGYEEALRLFTSTFGNALLQKNAHVLCMLGTLNFLTRNYVRAATMYETSHILRQHLPDVDDPTLEMTWCLTMLGLSYHFLGHYHQSIIWCVRAFKLYARFFRFRLLTVDALNRWFIMQNLYVLGIAGIALRLHKKALHYLNLCRNMIPEPDEEQDWDLSIRVLLALGDAYDGLADDTNKLKYYAEAQERAQKFDSGTKSGAVLSNEVLYRLGREGRVGQTEKNRLDGIFRERAVVQQQTVESSIKDDMVGILLKLGLTTGSETEIDWAIGCYDDCVQGYRNLQESSEAARALSSLGTLCQVKGRLQVDDSKERIEFLRKAENYFREAFQMVDSSYPVCVQFGNFLYGEGRYAEALEVLLPFVFCARPEDVELSYSGIEQMALPVHLHRNIQEEETLVVEARVLAKFLGLLCFRSLGMKLDADDALVEMYRSVVGEGSEKPLNYALLGYALLETRLFQEAAEAFVWSSWLQPESDLAYSNAWMSALLATYAVMAKGLDHLLQFVFQTERDDKLTFQEKKSYLRRQVSFKARKMMRDRNIEEAKEEVSNLRRSLLAGVSPCYSSSTPLQGTLENHDQRRETSFNESFTNHQDGLGEHYQNCVPSNEREADENSRRVALESRRWRRQQLSQMAEGSAPSPIGQGESTAGRQDRSHDEATARPGSGTRRKWRSRLYHNLPENPDSELLMTDARRPIVEQ